MSRWRLGAVVLAASVLSASGSTAAGPGPEAAWAWPALAPGAAPPAQPDPTHVNRLPGSTVAFTDPQLKDTFHAVDWRPQGRPPAPAIVRQGRPPDARACGFCHLPEGAGRPENATLAGLPADYIVRQMADMRRNLRRVAVAGWGPAERMHEVARAATPAEAKAAAQYFAARRYVPRTRVVEATTIPTAAAAGGVYRFAADGGREPLGQRIVEGPEDFERFELRDDQVRYVAYAPMGSIARGARLAATGDRGRTKVCADCHAAGLKGDAGPPLAGRSPTGLFRQLYAFKTGVRNGRKGEDMRKVAARLSTRDMIDLAAYAGSLRP